MPRPTTHYIHTIHAVTHYIKRTILYALYTTIYTLYTYTFYLLRYYTYMYVCICILVQVHAEQYIIWIFIIIKVWHDHNGFLSLVFYYIGMQAHFLTSILKSRFEWSIIANESQYDGLMDERLALPDSCSHASADMLASSFGLLLLPVICCC